CRGPLREGGREGTLPPSGAPRGPSLPGRRAQRNPDLREMMRFFLPALLLPVLPARAAVDFARDVRPILNAHCTACHGGVKEAGEVSFIYRDKALGKGES